MIVNADCATVVDVLGVNVIDSVVTDPPYGLSFMGKDWDHGIPGAHFWREALRVAKPGAHLVAFGGTRTYHRLTCAIEDAGWEIRDCLMWLYGQGFPKSLDVSKAIDKAAGAEREVVGERDYTKKQWEGWGTALKPAWESIILARKPLDGTVAANVLKWGTGALNIDACRIHSGPSVGGAKSGETVLGVLNDDGWTPQAQAIDRSMAQGRWPANVVLDEEAARILDAQSGITTATGGKTSGHSALGQGAGWNSHENKITSIVRQGDTGGASRFFYCAKASRKERGEGNNHPTVKPVSLMRWLCRLVTPRGGIVFDPFCGSGSTGVAALQEGFRFVGFDIDAGYCQIAENRCNEIVARAT